MGKIKILLLSGGSLVGRNLLDVLEGRRKDFYLITTNSIADEPSLFEYDEVLLSPELATQADEFSCFFDQVLDRYNPDFIIPCRDEDVLFLSNKKSSKIGLEKNKYLSGPEDIASSFLDKWKSYEMSKELGLPYAKTILANAEPKEISNFLEEVGFPVIAKPKKGFASKGVFLIMDQDQVTSLIGTENYIFQEYLGDPAKIRKYLEMLKMRGLPLFHSFEEIKISVQAAIGPDGTLGEMVVTSHQMNQGISNKVGLCQDDSIYSAVESWIRILIKKGWVGPLNIQCQKDQNGKLTIYEYNGRFTGATSGRFLMGYDFLGILLKLWIGIELVNSYEKCARVSVKRIPKSLSAGVEDIAILNAAKVWEKDPAFKTH